MIHLKKSLLTLVALFAISTGAWAEDLYEEFTTNTGASVYTGEHFKITPYALGVGGNDGFCIEYNFPATIEALNGEKITKVEFTGNDIEDLRSDGVTVTYNGNVATVSDVNATSLTIYAVNYIYIRAVKVYYTAPAPAGIDLTPDATRKIWTLDAMPAGNVELQVEYEPTKVTMAANDKTMGTVEVGGESKVEWTADTWNGWMSDKKENTVGDITMTSSQNASIYEYTYNTSGGKYLHSLTFFVSEREDNASVTFSTTGDPFSRIEFTMIDDYKEDYLTNNRWNGNPVIMPKDNWTFSGKSAVWEGEATKSLTLQSCTTYVSKITFFKGAIPDGVTVNGDGTFTVAKTATVTLTATPAEGYKFLYWEDDQTNTNPVREVTIESGMADMTYKAVFAEITYNVTFVEGTNPDPENPEWTATPNPAKTNAEVTVTYTGTKKVLGVKAEKKSVGPVTYTELKGGEVLHVGDKIQVPETDKYWYPGGETLDYRYTYEVVRVNISGSSYETTATESETGAYYALHKVGSNYYLFATGTIDDSSRLPATATSDGIAVADNGFTNGYHKYIFSVHEK